MRNWWLAAIAGHQGNVPSDIPEGPAGAEGTGGAGWPGCGARGPRCPWAAGPDNEPTRRSKLAVQRAPEGPQGLAAVPVGSRATRRTTRQHTEQPGSAAGPGAQKIRGSTSNNQRHTATRSVL